MITVIATLKIKAGTRDDVAAAAHPCIEATRKEAGCRRYDLTSNVLDPTQLVFVEEWESREALEAHFNTDHIKAWREAGKPFVESAVVEIIHATQVERL
ncbi:putative quinol monooxygenase [Aureimonas leprariae]|uniref:Antibiotic biosynthesis monooxygenase n=1 Tax=Plantimonas leprariae TaxID=2615207 RepID=A0A7V7TYK9_9HYPH|nr:putative quinol monooxygenase [Aureimonas leprariae]KAB0682827.1 antibiotic biosynthesis monooxygenase [Aureimonas leprariae]